MLDSSWILLTLHSSLHLYKITLRESNMFSSNDEAIWLLCSISIVQVILNAYLLTKYGQIWPYKIIIKLISIMDNRGHQFWHELLDESAYNIIPIINLVYQTINTNHTEVHSSLPIRSLVMKLTISRELVLLNLM